MIVLLHVTVAILSLVATSYAYLRPSSAKLKTAYSLVGMTLASGIYLVWSTPSHMLETCMAGLVYTGLVTIGLVAARTKLAVAQANHY